MGKVSNQEKEEVFKLELERIFDMRIREFTRLCIIAAPDYFFIDCPASSTSKFHPVDELSYDGCSIHTRKVFTLVYELCRGLAVEEKRDLLLAGSLIHDLRKFGVTNTGHTHKKHPHFAADLVDEVQSATMLLTDEEHRVLRNCVGYHYGPWSTAPWRKDITAYTMEELVVYISDYIASKRCVTVEYRR